MADYIFDLITKSGDDISDAGNLVSIGETPSINNLGSVAFIGKFGTGFNPPRDLLVADSLGDITNLSSSYTWRFGDRVKINDNNRVLTRDTASSQQILRIWDANLSNSYYVEAHGGYPANGLDFEWIYLYPSINNNEQVVFVADPKDGGTFNAALATRKENTAFGSRDYNEAIVPSAFVKPAIADNGTIVARETFSTITLSDYQLNPIAVIASTVSGFDSVGVAPDISSDGQVVAFYGDLVNPGANSTTQGLDAGEGIFISVETESGREIKRIAGIAGNGILDPNESHNDINENGEVDPGEDEGFIDDFNLDESVGISFTATESGGSGAVAYLVIDEDGNENLISSDFNISSENENEPTKTSITSNAIAKVGQEASQVSSELTGNIQDLNIDDPINDAGQVAFWTKTTTGDEAVIKADPIRKPVFILPGIGGSFPRHEDFGEWLLNRGVAPDTLEIDYLANTYDDLIQTLENAGYQQGVDLFVANYDWRLNPGPIDGNIDGVINRSPDGVADSVRKLTDDTYEYAVDQLAFWLKESITGWKSQFADLPEAEIPDLDSVDIIAHSTGGLVARSYIQSDAYGQVFTDDNGEQVNLPTVNNFISIGVPNRGASQAWNPIQNNFNTIDYNGIDNFNFRDLVANQGRLLLHTILRSVFPKVTRQNNPETIALSGNDDSVFAIDNPNISELEFIEQYVPTLKSLLATYPFIDLLPNNDNLQSIEEIYPSQRNNLVLDLNNGYDSVAQGTTTDPNLFVDDVELATIIYGENVRTDDAVRERDEPIREFEVRLPGITTGVPIPTEFPIEANLPQVPVGIWYEDVEGVAARNLNPPEFRGLQGDGTVPWLSSFGQFRNDSRTNLVTQHFNQGEEGQGRANTEESVDHGALVSNTDVQQLILDTLGVSLDEDLISTGLANPSFGDAFGALRNIIIDPVEGFLIDGQGRRLGYTNATGAITEIPGSLWIGATDGFGFIPDAVDLEGPFQLELTGLGEDYYVSVALETEDGLAGIEAEGFLAAGEELTLDVPLLPEVSLVPEPRTNAGGDAYVDVFGEQWLANDGFSGGRSYANANAIAQTDDDLLYQSEYLGENFDYSQDVPNWSYDVTLHFAEIYFNQPGRRVFDVSAEDQLILDNFDIFSNAGGKNIAVEKTFTVEVNDGTLDLDFLAEVNNAKISAVEIKPTGTTIRANGGEGNYTDSLGKEWLSNDGLSGGRNSSRDLEIAQTDNDLLYQTEYYGKDFDYSQSVANGNYDVTLHFAETVFNDTGKRVFDVSIEDQLILDNFDVFSEAGGKNIALEKTFTVGVNDGTLDLDFLAEVNNAKISAVEIKPDSTIARVNAGDDVYTDSLGIEWLSNDGLSGGRNYANSNEIAQTDNDLLYQSEYLGENFSYSQDVANGSYDVTLHFAEIYFNDAGRRVFDVSAEDRLILDNFDIFSNAGGKDIALERTFTVGVNDGTLDLDFLAEVNNAKISAIEIKPSII